MIRRLSPSIVHEIAAGEVIERPSSAIKELVENSLDAQASKISVFYLEGGLDYFEVEDDGIGFTFEDLSLAFEPHATSKLSKMDDFLRLNSFGFRGEALCSISAVSDVTLESCERGVEIGGRARVKFGSGVEIEKTSARIGTKIEVRTLFQRQPVRLKFLKSARAETLQIHQILRKYALQFSEVAFLWGEKEAKDKVRLPKATPIERALWFFDAKDPNEWIQISDEKNSWKFDIMLLDPRHFGKYRSGAHFFINRRPFRDSKLEFALRRALEGYTEYPRDLSAVVSLTGSPELFDVNVHPMKLEVRFVHSDHLFSGLVSTIKNSLQKRHQVAWMTKPAQPFDRELNSATESSALAAKASPSSPETFEKRLEGRENRFYGSNSSFETEAIETSPDTERPMSQSLFRIKSHYEYLAQIDQTYLVVKREDQLFLFDQHALHERILYEGLLKDFEKGARLPTQRLLFPLSIAFEGAEALLEKEELLLSLGFELRLWESSKIKILSSPAVLKRGHLEVLRSLVESSEMPRESLARKVLATLACHSAVRAHDPLKREEVDQILADFSSTDALGHCPHGRPTFVKFEKRDLEKLFHRIL